MCASAVCCLVYLFSNMQSFFFFVSHKPLLVIIIIIPSLESFKLEIFLLKINLINSMIKN